MGLDYYQNLYKEQQKINDEQFEDTVAQSDRRNGWNPRLPLEPQESLG